jgi:DNA-binding transcriptional LysR family regulator
VRIEFRDLRWAIVAAQHRSLRQAAEALNIRQSTLSRSLRDLEHHLGSAIFERTNGGTRPTVEGLEFLEAARRIIGETEAIVTRLKTRSQGQSGRLSVGVHASFSAGNLRATLIEHRKRCPDVEMHLIDGSSDHLISDLANSAIDIAFVAEGDSQWDGKSLSVWSERVVVVLPEHHALCAHDSVGWNDLRDEPVLLPQRGLGLEVFKLLVDKLGCRDACRFHRHDTSLEHLLGLVGAGWGISVALEGATGVAYPGVAFREVLDNDGPARIGFRAIWRQTNANPSLRPLLEILRERYPDLSGASAPG